MFNVYRFAFTLVLGCFIGLCSGETKAAQWPVHGGPVNQAVPQYRGRYPLQSPVAEPARRPISQAVSRAEASVKASATTPPAKRVLVQEPTNPAPVEAQPLPAARPASVQSMPPMAPKTPQASRAAESQKAGAGRKLKGQKSKTGEPVVRYDIYRDCTPLPIDPRKPVNMCNNPSRGCGCGGCRERGCRLCDAPGVGGKPYQEAEPGGCDCTKKKLGKNKPMFSQYWPRPFSAKLDERFPERANERYACTGKKRCVDVFDRFIDFKLVDYQRTDNGYCGEDSDPYGCLGESRMIASSVAGVGYRFPSVPVDRSAANKSFWY